MQPHPQGTPARNALLFAFSTLLTLAAALGLVRWLAPGLLGIPVDLQMVRASKAVPPFYENVFRLDDFRSAQFLIPGPWVTRAKPLINDAGGLGPHDLMGFRNRAIPDRATVITIGDSQTYGNNAPLEQNWPSVLGQRLGLPSAAVYSMATGGWSGPEYLYIATKARYLRPKVMIVAFYAGNDPLESFVHVYGNPAWAKLRPDPKLRAADAPKIAFPTPPEDIWQANFPDGSTMEFTPALRYSSQMADPAVDAGWEIMATAAGKISELCRLSDIDLIFTLIPTKERVMRPRIEAAGTAPPEAYRALVEAERSRSAAFVQRLQALPHGRYVDLVAALRRAAQGADAIYSAYSDGHPLSAGYRIIAERLADALDASSLRPPSGAYWLPSFKDQPGGLRQITDDGWWLFDGARPFLANGWRLPGAGGDPAAARTATVAQSGEFAHLPYLGSIGAADPARFSPTAVMGEKMIETSDK